MGRKAALITGVAVTAVILGGAGMATGASGQVADDQPLGGTELKQASDAALAFTGQGSVLAAETDAGAYEVEVRLPDAKVTEVTVDRSFRATGAEGPGDDDANLPPVSAEEQSKAGSAAVAKVGQGAVSEVERENEAGSAYEVEVRLNDGSQVEVQLGTDFQVLSQGAPERDDD